MILLAFALSLPPVTEEEAIQFHAQGRCVMTAPGKGLTGKRGWIGAYYPGRLKITGATFDGGNDAVDAVPGRVYYIEATGPVSWCPQFIIPGREACGAVPKAFLYDLDLPTVPIVRPGGRVFGKVSRKTTLDPEEKFSHD